MSDQNWRDAVVPQLVARTVPEYPKSSYEKRRLAAFAKFGAMSDFELGAQCSTYLWHSPTRHTLSPEIAAYISLEDEDEVQS